MTETVQLWEQQPDEPTKWYANFLLFRDLGSNRNLLAAYVLGRARSGTLAKSKPQSASYSWVNAAEAWDWRSRAEAWDIYERQEKRRRELERQREEDRLWQQRQLQHRNDMWDVGTQMLAIAKDMMQSTLYTRVIEREGDREIIKLIPAKWSFRDIPALIKLSDELRRQSTGSNVDHLTLLNELRQLGWIDDEASDRIATRLGGAIDYGRRAIAQSAAEMIDPEELNELKPMEEIPDEPDHRVEGD